MPTYNSPASKQQNGPRDPPRPGSIAFRISPLRNCTGSPSRLQRQTRRAALGRPTVGTGGYGARICIRALHVLLRRTQRPTRPLSPERLSRFFQRVPCRASSPALRKSFPYRDTSLLFSKQPRNSPRRFTHLAFSSAQVTHVRVCRKFSLCASCHRAISRR